MKFDTDTLLIVGALLLGLYLLSQNSNDFTVGVNSLPPDQRNILKRNPQYPNEHFWIYSGKFPVNKPNVTIMTDAITIARALGNEIAISNFILYVLDAKSFPGTGGKAFADGGGSMLEFNLICEDSRDYFSAILQGIGRHQFDIPVIVGHTYTRTVVLSLDTKPRTITYIVKDINTNQLEHFVGTLTDDVIVGSPEVLSQAIEYHDKFAKKGQPFPQRYEIKLSSPEFK